MPTPPPSVEGVIPPLWVMEFGIGNRAWADREKVAKKEIRNEMVTNRNEK